MVKFSEHFLDKLAPRNQAFEIKEEPDFAIRVFPNGSKTWVFINTKDQSVQRQTLGIYPQMSIEQAHAALRMARASLVTVKGVEEQTEEIAPTHQPKQAQSRKSKIRLASRFATAVVISALSVGVMLALQADEDMPTLSPVPQRSQGFVELAAPVAVLDSPDQAVGVRASHASASPDREPVDDRQVSSAKNRSGASETPNASDVPHGGSSSAERPVSAKVKRAQFTRGIENREPIDRITEVLPAWNLKQGAQQIFYFTEVSGLGGHSIRHRWDWNGRIVSEIPFEVKSSWRWRVFSSKNIVPTMAGHWRVSVVDDRDEVLHSEDLRVPYPDTTPASEAGSYITKPPST